MTGVLLERRHAFFALATYLVLVVYGSLVPFEVREESFDAAFKTFLNIPYLRLGIASRADWVANIVLYMPLSFLGCAWVAGFSSTRLERVLAVLPVVVSCIAIAVAVEFAQVFIAPRTVSQNDLIAESLGTLGGVLVWMLCGHRLLALAQAFVEGGRASVLAAITLYLLAYVALTLFPYDFLVSAGEIAEKLASRDIGWLVAGQCTGWVRCIAPRVAEVVAIAPLGVLLAAAAGRRLSSLKIFAAGFVLGVVLELMQVFIASGISQGLSALLRGVGFVVGVHLGYALKHVGPVPIARIAWRAAPYAAVPYLLAVAALSGWFRQSWVAPEVALERFGNVKLMPFYYHYFTTEREAMASLLAQAAIYAPVGLVAWARHAAARPVTGRYWLGAALAAAVLAVPFELGKLFGAKDQHPDPTNLLIAAVSAATACALAHWLESVLSGEHPRTVTATAETGETVAAPSARQRPPPPVWAMLLGTAAALVTVLGVLDYPVGSPVLAGALLVYGVVLYQRPTLWLLVIPVLLPVLDLSPLTGRLLLDEFDLFVLVTLAAGCWRTGARAPRRYATLLLPLAIVALWVTWLLSTARGLWPGQDVTGLQFDMVSSHSPLEAWQVGKGLLWALLLVPLLRRVSRDQLEDARKLVIQGIVTALTLVVLVVIWERHVFVGLADFSNVFRVTGTFASMRTGGAYIEAFIAFAFPVLAMWVIAGSGWSRWLFGIVATAATSYVMLVTFSRAGYAALVVGMAVVLLGVVVGRGGVSKRRLLVFAGLAIAAVVVALPVLSGSFAQSRLARSAEDLSIRLSHWAGAVELMDPGIAVTVTGMGFGRYPTRYLYALDDRPLPGTYGLAREDGNLYLQVGSGQPVYLEQRISHEPGTRYTLSVRLRQPDSATGSLRAALCEKALLYSFACIWKQLDPGADVNGWKTHSVTFTADKLSGGPWPGRPVRLSLYNPVANSVIHVDDVSLKTGNGVELLTNGSFNANLKRWLLVSDQDLAWHVHQQLVETYFAQGLLGLLALVVLLLAVRKAVLPGFRQGQPFAVAMTGAVACFLTVGLLGSVVDTARSSMLFYLGTLAAALLVVRPRSGRTRRHEPGPPGELEAETDPAPALAAPDRHGL